MDPDLNAYDVEHVCTTHPKMSEQEWQDDLSGGLVALLFARAHETLLRRAAATGLPVGA